MPVTAAPRARRRLIRPAPCRPLRRPGGGGRGLAPGAAEPAGDEGTSMRSLRVNGHDMAYAEHGSGTPLLLIHGTLLDRRYWAPQMEALGQRCRAIAPSLRHCWPGRYDGSGEGFTVDRHVEDVAAFITGLGAGPVHLLGHSRGGHVAFRVAQRFPDRVRALVLAEPGGSLDGALRPAQGASGAPAPPGTPLAEAVARAAERSAGATSTAAWPCSWTR